MADALLAHCWALSEAADSDHAAFAAALHRADERVAVADRPARHAALVFLGRQLERFGPARAATVAGLAGRLAASGADPAPVLVPIMLWVKTTAEAAAHFAVAWQETTGHEPPDPAGPPPAEAQDRVRGVLGEAVDVAAQAWWELPRWLAAATATLRARAAAAPVLPTGLSVADTCVVQRALRRVAGHQPSAWVVGALLAVPAGPRSPARAVLRPVRPR